MRIFQFTFPELGEGIHEGKIARWIVHEGEWVREDEPLAEVENDKAMVEIPSPVSGKIEKLFISEGETVSVGEPLVNFETEGAAPTETEVVPKTPLEDAGLKNVAQTVADVAKNPAATARDEETLSRRHVLAVPSVRKFAREHHVNIEDIKGTGEHGKITMADVEAHLSQQAPPMPESKPRASVVAPTDADEERIPLSGRRRAIAAAMVKSLYTAPQVTLMDEVNVTELVAFKAEFQAVAAEKAIKLTFLPFLVKGLVVALKKYPHLNAVMDEERAEIVLKRHYHIGIATDTEKGLLVPVLRHADRKSIWELAAEIADLAARGRAGKLQPEEMKGSTATITNIGSAQGLFFTPILNYPEVAILGVGRIREQLARSRAGEIIDTHMMAFSLSFDHRVVDGKTAQLALNVLKDVLEKPKNMLMEV